MIRLIRLGVVFVLSMALCGFIAWLGGYNFDERNILVAYLFFCAIIISVAVTACVEGLVLDLKGRR